VTGRVRITAAEVADPQVDAELAGAARLRNAGHAPRPGVGGRVLRDRILLFILAVATAVALAGAAALVIAVGARSRPSFRPYRPADALVLDRTAERERGRL
jgi:hypothetical protein